MAHTMEGTLTLTIVDTTFLNLLHTSAGLHRNLHG